MYSKIAFTSLSLLLTLSIAQAAAEPALSVKGVVDLDQSQPETMTAIDSGSVIEREAGRAAARSRPQLGLRDDYGGWERPSASSSKGMLSVRGELLRISELCIEAVEMAPIWLEQDLEDAFSRLGTGADSYAELLLGLEDLRLIDEVAFQIAHVAPRELLRLRDSKDEQLLVINARHIYEYAEELPYVRLVEHDADGLGSDFWTTTAYLVEDSGDVTEIELPMDYYYWYIVHPKINIEYVKMDDRPSNNQATYGYFWRQYLFEDPSEEYSYTKHYFEYVPNEVSEVDLGALTSYSVGHLTSRTNDLMPVVYDEDSGGVLLSEMRYGAGEIVATSIRLEQAYEDGVSSLLENVVLYGDCAQLMPENSKVLVIKDRGSTVIEDMVDENGYRWRVVGSDRIGDLSLTEYHKIIVPSDQPGELYEKLAENRRWITDWLVGDGYYGNIFEFHGACQTEDSWDPLSLPGMIKCSDLNNAQFGTLKFGGYPLLRDVMTTRSTLWDRREASKDGRRPISEEDNALIALGKWVNKVVPVLARDAQRRGVQANQIAMLHNGNCGECQDILGAAARTCLIPACSVDLHAEDHVWNEAFDEEWYFYEAWRGGVITTIGGTGTGVKDMDYGGRYPFSGVLRWRNDGIVDVITDRYSETCELEATVLDANGAPVDGALVEVWASNVLAGPYASHLRSVWGFTDESGVVTMKLGNTRNLYARAETPLGNFPVATDSIDEFAPYSQTGVTYSWEVSVSGEMPSLDLIRALSPRANEADPARLEITFDLPYQTLYCENPMDRNVGAEKIAPGHIDFFICDRENLDKLGSGETVSVFELLRDANDGSLSFQIGDADECFVVFSNRESLALNQALYYSIDVVDSDGQVQDSLANWVRVPAGSDHVVSFSRIPDLNMPPVIVEAGFLNTSISSSAGGEFKAIAYVTDPNGLEDIQHVELQYGGIPTGLVLRDDGTGGDIVAHDWLFTIQTDVMPGLRAGTHLISMVAVDSAGDLSAMWPYLSVKEGVRGPELEPRGQASHNLLQATESLRQQLLAAAGETGGWAVGSPVILAGGFGYSDISSSAGGRLTILAHVLSLDAPVETVETFLPGGIPLNMQLRDDGRAGDALAGDGQFTFESSLMGGLSPGEYLIEIVATASDGQSSTRFPYLTVTD